jgi:hypothetical protein
VRLSSLADGDIDGVTEDSARLPGNDSRGRLQRIDRFSNGREIIGRPTVQSDQCTPMLRIR